LIGLCSHYKNKQKQKEVQHLENATGILGIQASVFEWCEGSESLIFSQNKTKL
jgi:hypothetical protein